MTLSFSIEWLGAIAGICTTFSFLPQVIHVFKTRSTKDISMGMYVIFITGVTLWTVYGVIIGATSIVVANIVTLMLATSILVMKLKWR